MAPAPEPPPTLGVHYTPAPLVDHVIEELLGPMIAERPPAEAIELRLADPACGEGAFLLGAFRFLAAHVAARAADPEAARRRIVSHQLVGVDTDGAALARAAEALSHAAGGASPRLVQGNSLIGARADFDDDCPVDYSTRFPDVFDRERPGFDVVVGNPPYVDAEHMVRQMPDLRAFCRERYATARGNWDLFVPFAERALALTRQGGRHAFVVPNKLLGAAYAADLRAHLTEEARLDVLLCYAGAQPFAAHVYPLAYVVTRASHDGGGQVQIHIHRERGEPEALSLPRARFGRDPWPVVERDDHALPALEAVAEVRGAATVAEAYALGPLIRDLADPPADALRVLNSGTIDPHQSLWGERPLRYLKRRHLHPVVLAADQTRLPPRRLAQSRTSKVVVASMTRRLEAFADPLGRYCAAKSTTLLLPRPGVDLFALAALLNSAPASEAYRARFGGLAMSGGYLRVGPPELRALPFPLPAPTSEAGRALQRLGRTLARDPRSAASGEVDALAARLYQQA
ncbi:MAG: N-6 DNA methylase [Polyangiaceae bacterium]